VISMDFRVSAAASVEQPQTMLTQHIAGSLLRLSKRRRTGMRTQGAAQAVACQALKARHAPGVYLNVRYSALLRVRSHGIDVGRVLRVTLYS